MIFHFLSLFPESFDSYFKAGIFSRAVEKKLITIHTHALREFGIGNYRKVDDKVYGGGVGMIMRADVVVNAVEEIKKNFSIDKVILLSAKGPLLSHTKVNDLAKHQSILFVCGRYEGVDERAINLIVDEELSIGDYVLTGGELGAMIIADAVSRFIPGVIDNDLATQNESFTNGILEHPQYTRPEEYRNLKVPEVLLSGHHAEIEKWKSEQALEMTKKNRPDLYQKQKKS